MELRGLDGVADPALLRLAAARAEALGIGGDEVLRAQGTLDPDTLLRATAVSLELDIDWLEDDGRSLPANLLPTLRTGVLRWGDETGHEILTIAPQGRAITRLADTLRIDPGLRSRVKITSPERLRAYVQEAGGDELAEAAAYGLKTRTPHLSAAAHGPRGLWRATVIGALLFGAAAYFAPTATLFAIELFLAATFMAWAVLRIYACFAIFAGADVDPVPERELPHYTILAPLHCEARMVPELVAAISAIDYPREKLDVKLIVEHDDEATIAAIRAIKLDPCFEMLVAPFRGPRTKPKALQAALPFARGQFLVVYDAEDRPDPEQLRVAYAKFRKSPPNLACVQATLCVDNTRSTFLTGHFKAEYSGLFDVLLPALTRLRLPVPLGGTSNHFRTDILREVGGWDPHNVTEDADLGFRLARFGYRTGVIEAATSEEAPTRLGAWLGQRTRWFKGWLQTYLVHMRTPRALFRELGLRGFLAFQLLIGGTVLAALVHPVFVLWLLADGATGSLFEPSRSIADWFYKAIVLLPLIGGYVASASLAFVGMRRRGLPAPLWVLLTIPVYWLLLSAAAWRAVWKLIVAPHQWEKTEHGLVRRTPQRMR